MSIRILRKNNIIDTLACSETERVNTTLRLNIWSYHSPAILLLAAIALRIYSILLQGSLLVHFSFPCATCLDFVWTVMTNNGVSFPSTVMVPASQLQAEEVITHDYERRSRKRIFLQVKVSMNVKRPFLR